jgi:hypothetical protein
MVKSKIYSFLTPLKLSWGDWQMNRHDKANRHISWLCKYTWKLHRHKHAHAHTHTHIHTHTKQIRQTCNIGLIMCLLTLILPHLDKWDQHTATQHKGSYTNTVKKHSTVKFSQATRCSRWIGSEQWIFQEQSRSSSSGR